MRRISGLISCLDVIMDSFFAPWEDSSGSNNEPMEDDLFELLSELANERLSGYAAFKKILYFLAERDPYYRQFLPKPPKKRVPGKPLKTSQIDFRYYLKEKLCLALWVMMGNKIPNGNLRPPKVTKLIKERGYVYKRIKDAAGWYKDGQFIGRNIFMALEHLEQHEKVDRKKLAPKF